MDKLLESVKVGRRLKVTEGISLTKISGYNKGEVDKIINYAKSHPDTIKNAISVYTAAKDTAEEIVNRLKELQGKTENKITEGKVELIWSNWSDKDFEDGLNGFYMSDEFDNYPQDSRKKFIKSTDINKWIYVIFPDLNNPDKYILSTDNPSTDDEYSGTLGEMKSKALDLAQYYNDHPDDVINS